MDTAIHQDTTTIEVDFEYKRSGQSFAAKFSCGNGIGVISGPSGCGKTTVLRCIAGLLTPDRGTIRLAGDMLFDGANSINLSAQKRSIGFVPQNAALFPHMTVRQNILYAMTNAPKTLETIATEARLQEIATMLGIIDLLTKRPAHLSGGQSQRVALARAIAYRPNLYLMDEPLSSLDDEAKVELIAAMRKVRQVTNKPMLYVTHSESEAQQLADWRFRFLNGVLG